MPVTLAEGPFISTDLVIGPSIKGGSELRLDPDPVALEAARADENLEVDLVLPVERRLLSPNGEIGAFPDFADAHSGEKRRQKLRTATEARRKNRDGLLLGFGRACLWISDKLRGRV
jgi:hypothetical protein